MKMTKILSYITLGIEGLALIIIALITVYQKEIFQVLSVEISMERMIIPYVAIITEGILFVLYIAFVAVLHFGENINHVPVGVILVSLGCLSRIIMLFMGNAATRMMAAMNGVEYLAAYSCLTSVINMAVSPISMITFAFFCMLCGMYMMSGGMED